MNIKGPVYCSAWLAASSLKWIGWLLAGSCVIVLIGVVEVTQMTNIDLTKQDGEASVAIGGTDIEKADNFILYRPQNCKA